MRYDIDIKRFVGGLLPTALRGSVVELAAMLCAPFKSLHHRLMEYRRDKLWCMQYNAQTVQLEAMLNDYFGDVLSVYASGRRILVEEGEAVHGLYVYAQAEYQPQMVGCLSVTDYHLWGAVPFVVRIPEELEGNADIYNKVDRLVGLYKLTGTKHSIAYY